LKENKGVSLVEILVSIFILAIIIGPFAGIFVQSTSVRDSTSFQLKAIYTVRNEMEVLMSKEVTEAYASKGIRKVNDYYIRTSIEPYSVGYGSNCFYFVIRKTDNLNEEILIFTPDEHRSFLLENDGGIINLEVDTIYNSYYLSFGDQTISGNLFSSGKSIIYINLIEKQSSHKINFHITGDAHTTVYPGDDSNWALSTANSFTVVDKCYYRDYSIFTARIEAFEDEDLKCPIFEIQNIIKLKN